MNSFHLDWFASGFFLPGPAGLAAAVAAAAAAAAAGAAGVGAAGLGGMGAGHSLFSSIFPLLLVDNGLIGLFSPIDRMGDSVCLAAAPGEKSSESVDDTEFRSGTAIGGGRGRSGRSAMSFRLILKSVDNPESRIFVFLKFGGGLRPYGASSISSVAETGFLPSGDVCRGCAEYLGGRDSIEPLSDTELNESGDLATRSIDMGLPRGVTIAGAEGMGRGGTVESSSDELAPDVDLLRPSDMGRPSGFAKATGTTGRGSSGIGESSSTVPASRCIDTGLPNGVTGVGGGSGIGGSAAARPSS
jgi:hypothetical protein